MISSFTIQCTMPHIATTQVFSASTAHLNTKSTTNPASSIRYHVLTEEEIHNINRKAVNLCKLNEFAILGDNWDGYGTQSLDKNTLEIAAKLIDQLLQQPEIFPIDNSSIQFEWKKPNGEYLEIEINSLLDKWPILYINEEGQSSESSIHPDIINKLVSGFYANRFSRE